MLFIIYFTEEDKHMAAILSHIMVWYFYAFPLLFKDGVLKCSVY